MLALIPTYLAMAVLLLSLSIFAWIKRKGQRTVDSEVQQRHTSFLLGIWIRDYAMWILDPILNLAHRRGMTPTQLNVLGMIFGGLAGLAFAAQAYAFGAWALLFSGICDALDGRLARRLNVDSPAGAFLDATMDRIGETLAFTGLALSSHSAILLGLVVLGLGGSLLVSYTRAKGEAFGIPIKSGVMQRPERLALIIVWTLFAPLVEKLISIDIWLSLGFLAIVLGTWLTTIYRILRILDELKVQKP